MHHLEMKDCNDDNKIQANTAELIYIKGVLSVLYVRKSFY